MEEEENEKLLLNDLATTTWVSRRRVIAISASLMVAVFSALNFRSIPQFGVSGTVKYIPAFSPHTVDETTKTTIAYAVSVTGCPANKRSSILDGAAVLHQSIRLASRSSKYDYHMIAFVHPVAEENCASSMQNLGYEIQIRDTPFNETAVQSPDLVRVQGNSCCGFKEYLKLYSYVQFDYPVVVHLDLDCFVLKPLDDIFDLMLDPNFDRSRVPVMWQKPDELPERVDFVFTRDYGMVEPGVRQPHQVGVQGGFLIFRPSQEDFDDNVRIILEPGSFTESNWGGRNKGYGGFYGAGTIQGLASYYHGEISPGRSVELNRCVYNQMVDEPYGSWQNTTCRTLETQCEDCRNSLIENIFTAHFTNCGKPFWCPNPAKWWHDEDGKEKQYRLCMDLFREWHAVRSSLEEEWKQKYQQYRPGVTNESYKNDTEGFYLGFSHGHCKSRSGYIPMIFPEPTSEDGFLIQKEGRLP